MNFIPSHQREEPDWHHYPINNQHQYQDPLHQQRQHQPNPQYESLTGLLLQSGSLPTYFDDDESYKYHPTYEEEHNPNARQDEDRRGKSLFRKIKRYFSKRYDSPCVVLIGFCAIGILGALLGVMMPSTSSHKGEENTSQSFDWDTISNILGYTYFLSWTLSFYPQIITNCRRPHDANRGVSYNFLVWNVIGFSCYAVYVTSFLYSEVVRKEYADRFGTGGGGMMDLSALEKLIPRHVTASHAKPFVFSIILANSYHDESWFINDYTISFDNSTDTSTFGNNNTHSSNATTAANNSTNGDPVAVPQVKFNDVAFAWHALLLSMITYVQIVWFTGSRALSQTEEEIKSSIECSVRRAALASSEFVEQQDASKPASLNHAEFNSDEGSVLFNEPCQMHQRKQMQSQAIHDQLDSINRTNHKYKPRSQNISCITKFLVVVLFKFCIVGVLMVLCWSTWQWIDYLYFLSFVKVCISIVKYIPQVRHLFFSNCCVLHELTIIACHSRLFSTINASLQRVGRYGIFFWIFQVVH
jgi:hypothetical protein